MTARLTHASNIMAPTVGLKIEDNVEGLTVTQALARAGWRLPGRTVLMREGAMVKRADWDLVPIGADETVALITVPAGQAGASVANTSTTVLSIAALIILTPIIGPWGALAVSTLIQIGGKLLVSALMPKPKPPTPAKQGSPTYSLSSQSNQARLGQPIPELLGKHIIYCDLLAQPYFDFNDNAQRVYEWFGIGKGEYDVHQVRVAQTVIWEDGSYTGAYPEIEIEFVPPGSAVTLFPTSVVTSSEVDSITLTAADEAGHDWTSWFAVCAPGEKVTQINVDLSFPGGLFRVDSKGNIKSASVQYKVEVQPINDAGSTTGSSFELLNETISLSSRDPVRTTRGDSVDLDRYRVRAQRYNNKGDANTSDTLVWLSLRGYLPPSAALDDMTSIAIKAKSTGNLNGQSAQQFNVVATRKLPSYDTGTATWGSAAATRSIAAAASYLCRSANHGGLADSRVDWDTLWALHETWTDRGDYFDGIFDTRGSFWENLQSILRVGRAIPLIAGPVITFVRDEAKSVPRCAFSPRNMLPGSFEIEYQTFDANSTDALIVEFIDNRTWTMNEVYCALPDAVTPEDEAPRVQIFGITDRDHAWREGMFMAAEQLYRRIFPSFRTGLEGRVCLKGDLIKIGHWLPQWGASGEAVSLTQDAGGDIITISEPWSTPAGHSGDTKMVTLTTPDGQIYGPVTFSLVDAGATSRQAQLRLTSTASAAGKYAGLQPRSWGIWSGEGLQLERPRVLIGTGTISPRDAVMVSMKPEAGGTVSIVAVIEDARVHEADEGDPPEETDPPSDPAADDLTVTGITIFGVKQADGSVLINVTIAGAVDAASFQLQWKWEDATHYGPIYSTSDRHFTFLGEVGDLSLQARAVGVSGIGDWFTAAKTIAAGDAASPAVISILRSLGFGDAIYLEVEAGNADSYDGSSQTLNDTSGQGNNFYRGTSGSTESTVDPPFHGTAGGFSTDEYFYTSWTGQRFELVAGSNPAAINAMHKTNAKWSVGALIWLDSGGSLYVLDTMNATNAPGIRLYVTVASGTLRIGVIYENDPTQNINEWDTSKIALGWNYVGWSFDHAAGVFTMFVNGETNVGGGLDLIDDSDANSKAHIGPFPAARFEEAFLAHQVYFSPATWYAFYSEVRKRKPDFALP